MKRLFLPAFFALLCGVNAFAHESFTLVGSERKSVKEADLVNLERSQTTGKKDKTNLTFTEKEIRLVAVTGPEDDMLSYRIQGVRNPNLVVPGGATLKILFVNADVDMRHDIRFGHVTGEFPIAPDIAATAGSQKLEKRSEDDVLQAEELAIEAKENGAFKYFCSVRGHAKGGMWGNILVGVKPGDNLQSAPKTKHVHSPDEDHEANSTDSKKPGEKKPEMNHDEMPGMKMDGEKVEKSATSPAHNKHNEMEMRAVTDINVPMTREFRHGLGSRFVADARGDENFRRRLDLNVSRQCFSALHERRLAPRF